MVIKPAIENRGREAPLKKQRNGSVMKLSRRKMELMLVDIAIIICVYYMTNLVKVLRLHSIVLNGEINLSLRQHTDLSDHYGL